MAFVGTGPQAVLLITTADFFLLLCAGIFNPIFAVYRMDVTPERLMIRVGPPGARTVQPLAIAVGGVVATLWTSRSSLLVAGVLCAGSAVLLPWRGKLPPSAGSGDAP
ncbi:hypothetical protein ACWENQ_08080 [Nonomuraea sp. NPDC004354]